MPVSLTHPDEFETNVTPELTTEGDRIQYDFNSLMARAGREFLFVDYLFEMRDSSLKGAVGTTMAPVHVDEAERMKEKYCNAEVSPLYHIFEELETTRSWDDWIESQFALDGYRVIYDNSYEMRYGEDVEFHVSESGMIEKDDIELIECLGGGRMFNSKDRSFDSVYDEELLRLVNLAEENGLGELY